MFIISLSDSLLHVDVTQECARDSKLSFSPSTKLSRAPFYTRNHTNIILYPLNRTTLITYQLNSPSMFLRVQCLGHLSAFSPASKYSLASIFTSFSSRTSSGHPINSIRPAGPAYGLLLHRHFNLDLLRSFVKNDHVCRPKTCVVEIV
jgi:hypothetical protein